MTELYFDMTIYHFYVHYIAFNSTDPQWNSIRKFYIMLIKELIFIRMLLLFVGYYHLILLLEIFFLIEDYHYTFKKSIFSTI